MEEERGRGGDGRERKMRDSEEGDEEREGGRERRRDITVNLILASSFFFLNLAFSAVKY